MSTSTSGISRAERTELRGLLKGRFKLLRADVAARRSELYAELERLLTDKFAAQSQQWADAAYLIAEAAREANRKANDVIRGLMPDFVETEIITSRTIGSPTTREREQLRRAKVAEIDATVREAEGILNRQEQELLERLAVGTLESEQARAFLAEIPTVAALVPAGRLLALEQALKDEEPGDR